jgi:hypothetical protein
MMNRFLYIHLPLASLALVLQIVGVTQWSRDGNVKWLWRGIWLSGVVVLGAVLYDIIRRLP